jgi:hypothetical protein
LHGGFHAGGGARIGALVRGAAGFPSDDVVEKWSVQDHLNAGVGHPQPELGPRIQLVSLVGSGHKGIETKPDEM